MAQTSREIMTRSIRFETPERMPRDVWILPWASQRYPETVQEIQERFPSDLYAFAVYRPAATADLEDPPDIYRPSSRAQGDPYAAGRYTDEWGCRFQNIQPGVIGEIREPLIADIEDWQQVEPPYETLPEDQAAARDTVNRICASMDKFTRGGCLPRPWERLQFLRGSQNAMLDVMDADGPVRELLRAIHEFYLKELEFWVTTDVDACWFMDDWGEQRQLLIPPPLWNELFKPLYKDYCDLMHAHGKIAMMHSDGHIEEIYEDLIEVGVDALNSQIFCMDMDRLAERAKGRITFWGEIDRQHVLPSPDPDVGRAAARRVFERLHDPTGGLIGQFEFGPGAHPETVLAILEEWDRLDRQARA